MTSPLDILYLLIILVFGGLILHALVMAFLQSNQLSGNLQVARQKLDDLEERLDNLRQRLRQTEAEGSFLEQEREALESQEACMRQLEVNFKRSAHRPDGDNP